MLIDLHTHTFPKSDDSFMGPDELVEAAKGLGLEGICITEHDYFWEREDIVALAQKHDFLVLAGCEVNTDGGHALVFGLEKYVFGMHRVAYLSQLVDEAGGAWVAAHPYRRRYRQEHADAPHSYSSAVDDASMDPFFSACHAIETLNGRATDGENAFSVDVSRRLGLGMVGGSDAHRIRQLGGVATRFSRRITCLEELVGELRSGRFEPVALGLSEGVESYPSLTQQH